MIMPYSRTDKTLATIAALFAIAAFILLFSALPCFSAEESRTFRPMAISRLAFLPPGSAAIPTHISAEGVVTYAKSERDGDRHIRLSDPASGSFIVLECVLEIPALRISCGAIRKNQHIRARGISRYDGAPGHGWAEINPILGIEVIP